MFEKYYALLGVRPGIEEKDLKKVYRKLAMKYHPDVNKRPDAGDKFRDLCEAYEIVLHQEKKEAEINVSRSYEEDVDPSVYEEIIREAREKAQARARMKYEKLKAEQEFFENNDLFLLFRYIGHYLAIPLGIGLIMVPVYLAITEEFMIFFGTFFFWVIGLFILGYIYSSRKTWFRLGKFKTGWKDVVDFFRVEIREDARETCFYSPKHKADSTPFRYSMLKVRDVQLQNHGPFMHSVAYRRKYHEVVVPRSAHAYRVHFIMAFVKPVVLLLALIFFPVPSFMWRVILGISFAFLISEFVQLVTLTRSKTAYLVNPFLIIKVAIWLVVIISQTTYYPGLVFYTTSILGFLIFLLLFFLDMVLDLIFRFFPFYHVLYQPLTKQPGIVMKLFGHGYQNYLDIPVWSTLYPFLRWLF
ncbi:MAG TPA: DnaJ domain-containing protein [Bacteroidales bacterium]|nr:DnaJ domain-containing protein [Bacteroidales bacterium]